MSRHFPLGAAVTAILLAASVLCAADPASLEYPGRLPKGAKCECLADATTVMMTNSLISASWSCDKGVLQPDGVGTPKTMVLNVVDAFALEMRDGTIVHAYEMRIVGKVESRMLSANTNAARQAERIAGCEAVASLQTKDGTLGVEWHAILREGSNYVRQKILVKAIKGDADVAKVILFDHQLAGAEVSGTVPGSPVVAGNVFAGVEHPMSKSEVPKNDDGRSRARCWLELALPIKQGKSFTCSSVIGVSPEGQMRRGFLYYLERERAHPYRPFLHYNSWYDVGYGAPFNEEKCLNAIRAFSEELCRKRGVTLDSFLFDDGWDDTSKGGRWEFHAGFPKGFTPLREAAKQCGAAPGVWLSPWGGYGQRLQERVDSARAAGYETLEYDTGGEKRPRLALSGPKYYAQFHKACERMITDYGINQFKFDGTGTLDSVGPGSEFGSDFEAAIRLIEDLRTIKPDLFVNVTTGTWPSPFWLPICDSIWRGGADHSFAGVGTDRQRWITYRDADTYEHVVKAGPLYPLNSLMLCGLIYAKHAERLDTDPANDFTDEVRTFFASGTQLQELYISPGLLTPKNWDALAECAKWSRANAGTLVDTHWIGGDPRKLAVYGWASWSKAKGTFALRNPSDKEQPFTVELAKIFELPEDAAKTYKVAGPFSQRVQEMADLVEAGKPMKFVLKPFEVLVFEAVPETADTEEPTLATNEARR